MTHLTTERPLLDERHDLPLELAQPGAETGLPPASVGLAQQHLMVAKIESPEPMLLLL